MVTTVMVAVIVFETIRFAEYRAEIRHEIATASKH
jgi:hypothetical protein